MSNINKYKLMRKMKLDLPEEFSNDTIATINRIEHNINTIGVLYFFRDMVKMYTLPRHEMTVFFKHLPQFTDSIRRAISEIDVHDELITYRIVTKKTEIIVAGDTDFSVCVMQKTATINTANPIVDRIMDDDSVEGVVMTNKEGAPILTNVSVTGATNYGRALHKFGMLSQMYVKELNPTEEIMIIRINTKKNEIMVAPDKEFSIVVIQHSRARRKVKDKREKNK